MSENSEFPIELSSDDIVESAGLSVVPMDVDIAVETYRRMTEFIRRAMRPGVDYGLVPGTTKPSLYKPGAEKLQRFFAFQVKVSLSHSIEQWEVPVDAYSYPLFHYRYTAEVRGPGGVLIATCDGEANSYESKYHWRWVPSSKLSAKYKSAFEQGALESQLGNEMEFAFAIDKKETTGQYGKPPEYWAQWEEDIANGVARKISKKTRSNKVMDAWERDGSLVRIPNDDIYSQVNTLLKMAQKRAYVGAIILAGNASEFFTQDIEEYAGQLDEYTSTRTFVPDKDVAARRLMEYVRGLGEETPGPWIKALLEDHGIEWSLENWAKIMTLIDEVHNVGGQNANK